MPFFPEVFLSLSLSFFSFKTQRFMQILLANARSVPRIARSYFNENIVEFAASPFSYTGAELRVIAGPFELNNFFPRQSPLMTEITKIERPTSLHAVKRTWYSNRGFRRASAAKERTRLEERRGNSCVPLPISRNEHRFWLLSASRPLWRPPRPLPGNAHTKQERKRDQPLSLAGSPLYPLCFLLFLYSFNSFFFFFFFFFFFSAAVAAFFFSLPERTLFLLPVRGFENHSSSVTNRQRSW